MDMSPFANNNPQTMQTPDYLKQDPRSNSTMPGAISNMVKAMMDGNNKFQQRAGMGMSGSPGAAIPGATGPTSFGGSAGPMPLAGGNAPIAGAPMTNGGPDNGSIGAPQSVPSPADPAMTTYSGGAGPMARGPNVFESGASPVPQAWSPGVMPGGGGSSIPGMPNGADRTMSALFSTIPGGGMFGV